MDGKGELPPNLSFAPMQEGSPPTMSTLSNRTIIVTGGAQGIGAASARGLAASGAAVAMSL